MAGLIRLDGFTQGSQEVEKSMHYLYLEKNGQTRLNGSDKRLLMGVQ